MNASESLARRRLWLRLRAYDFADLVPPTMADHIAQLFGGREAFTRAFAAKIARKHSWTLSFALRAVDEYKKYVYLGVTSKYVVTPPKAIDVVWHEHILFTQGYRHFCNSVLEQDFDHHPELVAMDDQTAIFNAQYDKVLEYYQREFNREPPADIWGTPKFNPEEADISEPRRKPGFEFTAFGGDHTPLYLEFSDDPSGFYGFGGSGEFDGGGTGGSWNSESSGSAPSDGGSGCSGGGGCSGGCGGS